MRFLEKFRKEPAVSDTEVTEIRERVQEMRMRVGRRDVKLADLFALLGEDERPALREMNEVKQPAITRVWPAEVPSSQPVLQLATGEPGGANRLVKLGPDKARLVVGAGRSRLDQ